MPIRNSRTWLSMISFRQPFRGSYPITLGYGEKFPPLYTDESPHRGIDYGCPSFTPILASADGTVTTVGNLQVGYGKYIKITHDEKYDTVYAHLSRIDVMYGAKVKRGNVIGMSGSSGNSTGPHLHFEIRKDGIQIDPMPLMQSELDAYPPVYTPHQEPPGFEHVQSGVCVVCADAVNARCHCDMTKVITVKHKGDKIAVGDQVTWWNDLPFRDYYDPTVNCWLRIAEHDIDTQLIRNCDEEIAE